MIQESINNLDNNEQNGLQGIINDQESIKHIKGILQRDKKTKLISALNQFSVLFLILQLAYLVFYIVRHYDFLDDYRDGIEINKLQY